MKSNMLQGVIDPIIKQDIVGKAMVQVLLYHIAELTLYSFLFVFLYLKKSFACLASINFSFVFPCMMGSILPETCRDLL